MVLPLGIFLFILLSNLHVFPESTYSPEGMHCFGGWRISGSRGRRNQGLSLCPFQKAAIGLGMPKCYSLDTVTLYLAFLPSQTGNPAPRDSPCTLEASVWRVVKEAMSIAGQVAWIFSHQLPTPTGFSQHQVFSIPVTRLKWAGITLLPEPGSSSWGTASPPYWVNVFTHTLWSSYLLAPRAFLPVFMLTLGSTSSSPFLCISSQAPEWQPAAWVSRCSLNFLF